MTISLDDLIGVKLRTTDALEVSDCRAVKNHLKAWRLNAYDRIGPLRVQAQADLAFKAKFDADKKTVDDYKEILSGILDVTEKKIAGEPNKNIRVIRREEIVQSIAAFYSDRVAHKLLIDADEDIADLEVDACYVGTLATAPWNLALNSPVDDDSGHLITKGSGSILLLSLVKDAFFRGCAYLYLKPLEGSVSFYSYLQMKLTADETYFYLDLKLKISSVFVKNVATFQLADGEEALTSIA